MNLRPYQKRVIEQLYNWFDRNPDGHPVVNACVGAGKSVLLAHVCHEASSGFDSRSRVLMVVPSKELAEQNLAKLIAVAPDLRVGVLSASLGRKDACHDKDVILGTIGTLVNHTSRIGKVDLIVIDECHFVSRSNTGMYRQLVSECQMHNPGLRVIGWTGTPFRGTGIWLHDGEDRLFTDVAAKVGMRELIDGGYLAPLVPAKTATQVSAEGIGVSNGDYIVSQLDSLINEESINSKVAKEIVQLGAERNKWLVYCVTVDHAENMAAKLFDLGVNCRVLSAKTPRANREATINDFREGKIRAIVNVAVLTTGFDVPDVDLIALVRNTRSPVLYTQIAGRGMRMSPGKTNCLWLDFTDTTEILGPVDQITGKKSKDKVSQNAPTKLCEECGASNPAGAAQCQVCFAPFPEKNRNINPYSSGSDVLSQKRIEEIPVDRVSQAMKFSKKDGTPYLSIIFWSGLDSFNMNLFFDHDGYAKQKSAIMLSKLTEGDSMIPRSSAQAKNWLDSGRLRFVEIESITVDMGSKWREVLKVKLKQLQKAA